MIRHEYKVIPAPEKARKVRGLKGPALFANAVEDLINDMAADGWAYLRADTLPHEERSGLTSKVTTHRNLLIFQREIVSELEDPAPRPAARPAAPEATAATSPHAPPDPGRAPDAATPEPAPLFPNRQGKGVDL